MNSKTTIPTTLVLCEGAPDLTGEQERLQGRLHFLKRNSSFNLQ